MKWIIFHVGWSFVAWNISFWIHSGYVGTKNGPFFTNINLLTHEVGKSVHRTHTSVNRNNNSSHVPGIFSHVLGIFYF